MNSQAARWPCNPGT